MAASSSTTNEWTEEENNSSGRFTRYNVIIGKGSTKTVYKGFDHLYGTEIAWSKIKLSPEKEKTKKNLEKLCEEPKLLMSLEHPNLTKCYHYWKSDRENVVNMITEYCSSGNLELYCREHVRNLVGYTAIKNWCRQILKALHYLHSRDSLVKHGDVNCANMFVKGNTSTIKLGDFGRAKEFELGSSNTDILSFGLRVTQIVTLAETGFMSTCISEITAPQIKEMLSRCIKLPPDRPTAMDLLNDSFLAVDEFVDTSTASSSNSVDGFLNLTETVRDQVARLLLPTTEVIKEINTKDRKFRLQGKMSDLDSNSVTLKFIIDGNDIITTIDFEFILGVDTITDIVDNINVEFILFSADEVALISEIIKQLVTELQDEPHDSSKPSVAGEDWCLQNLFSEENSSDETSDDAQNQASTPSNRS